MDSSTPGSPVLQCLPESAQTHVSWVSNTIQSSHPLLPPSPPASIFPSIRVFSNELALHIRWPKYWSFSFSISPSNEYYMLISFRSDWFYLFAVQGTLKSLLQHHNQKASINSSVLSFFYGLSLTFFVVILFSLLMYLFLSSHLPVSSLTALFYLNSVSHLVFQTFQIFLFCWLYFINFFTSINIFVFKFPLIFNSCF